MVSADMDFNQLEAFLTSQTKRRENAMSEEQANVYRKFWKTHKNKIHDVLVSQSNWNNSLKKVSWRIDIKSQSRNVDQMSEPTAIVELMVGEGGKDIKVYNYTLYIIHISYSPSSPLNLAEKEDCVHTTFGTYSLSCNKFWLKIFNFIIFSKLGECLGS